MKNKALLVIALAVFSTAFGWCALAEDTQTLTGEYLWERREMSGPLEAVFTPAGEGKWEVSFHFTFREESHTYTGMAEGSLTEGALSGEVLNESKERTFTFTGAFDEGVFTGTHAEIREGKKIDTGTMTLKG